MNDSLMIVDFKEEWLMSAPEHGYCTCGWPLFRDGTCSNGECPDGGGFDDEDEDEAVEE